MEILEVKNDLEKLINNAEKDRFALIIEDNSEYIDLVKKYAWDIYKLYPCTGILVKSNSGGRSYHITRIGNVNSIERFGLLPGTDETATYGDGVIYAFPDISCFCKVDPDKWTLFEIEYEPGCLKALITFDKEDGEQGEVLIFPDKIKSCNQISIPEELRK